MANDLNPDYHIGLPAPDDTPEDIEQRDRMWQGIKAKLRAQETWIQMIRRIVKGWVR